MNNLIDVACALSLWWSYTKCKINIRNIKYLTIPIIYIIISMLVVPKNNLIIGSEIAYNAKDTYSEIIITKDDKVNEILDKYNLTMEEFKVICGVVLSEAEANSYEDAYAVINTIYNRTKSKSWVSFINNRYGNDTGKSMYYQVIAPYQFVVYQSGSYKKNINNTDSLGYNAIIDFLYSEEIMHNYLSFRAHTIKVSGSESFSDRGNNYFNLLKDENRI